MSSVYIYIMFLLMQFEFKKKSIKAYELCHINRYKNLPKPNELVVDLKFNNQ